MKLNHDNQHNYSIIIYLLSEKIRKIKADFLLSNISIRRLIIFAKINIQKRVKSLKRTKNLIKSIKTVSKSLKT